MERLNRTTHPRPALPERVVQFGGGNFLRCFVDWQLDILNKRNGLGAGVVIVRRAEDPASLSLDTQDGLYTSVLRGYDDGGGLHDERRIVSCVQREVSVHRDFPGFLEIAHNPGLRFVVSNTTEAGIAYDGGDRFDDTPPSSFPAKLTRLLHERFDAFDGDPTKGLVLLPCELVDHNGEQLREVVLRYIGLWDLSAAFRSWVLEANTFCSTLVDRIVTGHPTGEIERLEEELGYRDRFLVAGEHFHLFLIEAPEGVGDELKLAGSGLDIRIVDDLTPYRQRKVGILNGCHTALAPIAHLCGIELVRDAVDDPQLERYLLRLLDEEIIPGLPLGSGELRRFADAVIARFRNPFIDHRLLDISLNSMTKFRTRLLPQLLSFAGANGSAPPLLTLALAALICFHRGRVDGHAYPLRDDEALLDLYADLWGPVGDGPVGPETAAAVALGVLGLDRHWGTELVTVDGLLDQTARYIADIADKGMRKTLEEVLR